MKVLLIIIFFVFQIINNLSAQSNFKDDLSGDLLSYAGVYEGELDVYLCCDVVEPGYGSIVIYYDNNDLNYLYDGLDRGSFSLLNNVHTEESIFQENRIFGKLVKDNYNNQGLLYYFENGYDHPDGTTSFLKKIGDNEMAAQIYLKTIKENAEFIEFEKGFR